MTVSVEEINSTQKRIKITIAVEQVDTAFNKAYTNLKKKAKIQGFRQGKAPLNMIKKLYGGSVASQVGEDIINAILFEQIREHKIRIVSSRLSKLRLPEAGKEYEFSAVVTSCLNLKSKTIKVFLLRFTNTVCLMMQFQKS